jgi:ATP-binding cassette subfamily B protein
VEVIRGLDLKVAAGERVSIVGTSGAGKSTLAALLCGLQEADRGTIQMNNIHLQDADRESLRRVVGLVTDTNEIFAGTVEENIVVGRPGIDYEDVEWALEFTRLTDELKRSTPVVSEGRNLSHGQIQRLLIARAIVGRPSLLILDEAFTGIDERDKIAILDNIYRSDQTWTVIDISHDPEVVERSQTIRVLEDGQIVESKTLAELRRDPKCKFVTLFPSLCLSKKSSAAPSPESSS